MKFLPATAKLILASTAAIAWGGQALADDVAVLARGPADRTLTDAEVVKLKPVVNPLPIPDTSAAKAGTSAGPHAPGVVSPDGAAPSPQAVGSFGIPYTTTRVQDGRIAALGATGENRLSVTYPYRTVGKLTMSAGYCSASLIRRSVIVTAAHCIQNFGDGNSTFTNFQFWPGHYGAEDATPAQIAPHGTWTGWKFVRPDTWANGTDIGSDAARDNDLAVIALRKNSRGQFVGDITGYLGYGLNNYSFVSSPKTGNLVTGAVSALGYPFLMDSGAIMQRTDGPAYTTTIGGAGQLWQGSNFTGGSSGGPWIVNFRSRNPVLSGGAVRGSSPRMAVVGVTSWGSDDPNMIKDNYSSQFRQNTRYPLGSYGIYGGGNIGSLLNTLCNSAAPGGGTLASQGYCD